MQVRGAGRSRQRAAGEGHRRSARREDHIAVRRQLGGAGDVVVGGHHAHADIAVHRHAEVLAVGETRHQVTGVDVLGDVALVERPVGHRRRVVTRCAELLVQLGDVPRILRHQGRRRVPDLRRHIGLALEEVVECRQRGIAAGRNPQVVTGDIAQVIVVVARRHRAAVRRRLIVAEVVRAQRLVVEVGRIVRFGAACQADAALHVAEKAGVAQLVLEVGMPRHFLADVMLDVIHGGLPAITAAGTVGATVGAAGLGRVGGVVTGVGERYLGDVAAQVDRHGGRVAPQEHVQLGEVLVRPDHLEIALQAQVVAQVPLDAGGIVGGNGGLLRHLRIAGDQVRIVLARRIRAGLMVGAAVEERIGAGLGLQRRGIQQRAGAVVDGAGGRVRRGGVAERSERLIRGLIAGVP